MPWVIARVTSPVPRTQCTRTRTTDTRSRFAKARVKARSNRKWVPSKPSASVVSNALSDNQKTDTPGDTTQNTSDTSRSKPPLTDYPHHRTRLSLALDPYSRMSLPNRAGNQEVQKRPTSDILWGAVMCFITISILGLIDQYIHTKYGLPFMAGSWGTISILAFGTLENPAARYYNCIVATVFSTFLVSVIIVSLGSVWYSRAIGMAVALAFMMWTGSVHPPGAAAVMACMDQVAIQELGFWYVAYPVLFGSLFILAMGKACTILKHKYEFVVLFRWRRPGHIGTKLKTSKGHPVLYRKSSYGFSRAPVFLKSAADTLPAAVAIRKADKTLDQGGVSEVDALNDASMDSTSETNYDISIAQIDTSKENQGVVTYSFG